MQEDHDVDAAFRRDILATVDRLRAAGIVAEATIDADDEGVIVWTDGYHALLMAGRTPLVEPSFQAAWAAGPAAVRAWITCEAAALRGGRGSP